MTAAQARTLRHRWRHLLARLLAQPSHLLILQLTAVLIVLHEIETFPWMRAPERLLALVMLFSPRLMQSKWAWIILSGLLGINNFWRWSLLVNHEYLTTYWVLACTLALYAPAPEKVMAWNARLLIGLCFALAAIWKFLGGEYLDGSFLHLTFLLDPRMAMGAFLFGGVEGGVLQQNRTLLEAMQTTGSIGPQVLQSSPRMAAMSLLLSYWTIFIEAIAALSFLLPRPKILTRLRYWILLLFIFTTYTVIPVLAFGALLLIMGLAQCMQDHPRWNAFYLGTLLLLPLWMPLPQAIFSLWSALTP